jgi:hydrogenase maturation protease
MPTYDPFVPPVLVLGLGNVLLGDDGAGAALVREMRGLYKSVRAVECIDGGTQGVALLGYFAGREALVILDAYASRRGAGSVSVLEGTEVLSVAGPRSITAHEGNAGELLCAAALLDILPTHIFLVGIEPEGVHTKFGLSEPVRNALPAALVRACGVVERVLTELGLADRYTTEEAQHLDADVRKLA